MARFETYTVGSQFIVLPKGLKFPYPDEPEANYIDKLVAAKLKQAADRPLGPLRRRDLPPPRLPRHRRPAADRRGVQPVHGLDRPRPSGPS